MKKTILAAALIAANVASVAEAAVFDFAGTFQMRDPTGALMQNDTTLTGTMDLDMGTGAATASIVSTMPFFGSMWTAHDITMQMTGPATAAGDMMFDWGATTNIHVTVDFGVTMNGDGSIDFVTLDGPSADGIAGNPMDNGPFPGFNAAFLGTATPQEVAAVPVPAAVWLFGSGLLGLVGVARRKAA